VNYAAPLLAAGNIAISIPLFLGKIPPNKFYGFRTRKTLSNDQIWYAANFKGAVNLIVASLAAMVIGVPVSMLVNNEIAPFVNLFVLISAVSIAMVISLVQLKRL
jgi:hypothetical protein